MKRKMVNIVFKMRNACTKCYRLVVGKNKFLKDKKTYTTMLKDNKFLIKKENIFPRYLDYIQNSGNVDEHYFYQDIYMARKVLERKPERHYDVGSRLDGFISHLLTVRDNIIMMDVRPLPYTIEGLNFLQADAINMPGIPDESIESLSCLHALEHFGLGRYGDPIDPYAWKKTLNSFQRVLKKGGYCTFLCQWVIQRECVLMLIGFLR